MPLFPGLEFSSGLAGGAFPHKWGYRLLQTFQRRRLEVPGGHQRGKSRFQVMSLISLRYVRMHFLPSFFTIVGAGQHQLVS